MRCTWHYRPLCMRQKTYHNPGLLGPRVYAHYLSPHSVYTKRFLTQGSVCSLASSLVPNAGNARALCNMFLLYFCRILKTTRPKWVRVGGPRNAERDRSSHRTHTSGAARPLSFTHHPPARAAYQKTDSPLLVYSLLSRWLSFSFI